MPIGCMRLTANGSGAIGGGCARAACPSPPDAGCGHLAFREGCQRFSDFSPA